MKKRKLSEDFELIYLRHGEARKNLHKVKNSDLLKPEVQKIIKFSTKKHFDRNMKLLLGCGYHFEDLQAVITVYAATFIGSEFTGDSRGTGLLMMNFIDQRVYRFIEWVTRKFSIDEIVQSTSFSSVDNYGESLYATTQVDSLSEDEPLSRLDQMDEFEFAMERLNSKKDATSKKTLKLIKEKRSALKKEIIQSRKDNKNKTIELKGKINENHHQYVEDLIYYSTSKHVSKDIRQAARRYCKKFDIDYKTRIKALIQEKNYDVKEFTF